MRIHVVCRLNQARSIIGSALIRKLYPEYEVFSSGIAAQNGALVPQFIIDIALHWGLEDLDHSSTLFELGEAVHPGDLVICADSSIYEHLRLLEVPGELLDITQYSIHDSLIPQDPLHLSHQATEIELAKMAISTISVLESRVKNKIKKTVTALIVDSDISESAISYVRSWLANEKGFAIDMNWRIPDAELWSAQSLPVVAFNPRHHQFEISTNSGPSILSSAFEIDNMIELIATRNWRNSLLSLDVPILLIVNGDSTISSSANAIFSLLGVDTIVTFSRKAGYDRS